MAKLDTNVDGPVKERAEFEILPVNPNAPKHLNIDGHEIKFKRNGMAITDDIGLAREVDARVGTSGNKQYVVVPVQKREDPDHKRTFLVRLPDKLRENLRNARAEKEG